MPMYEYQCNDCGIVFEVRQKFSDPLLSECRTCGGSVQKLISRTGFSLKGNGWYQQGYSSGQTAPAPPCKAADKSEACAACPKAVNE